MKKLRIVFAFGNRSLFRRHCVGFDFNLSFCGKQRTSGGLYFYENSIADLGSSFIWICKRTSTALCHHCSSFRERYEFDHRFVSILHFSHEIYGFSYLDDNDKYSEKETKPVYKKLGRYDFFFKNRRSETDSLGEKINSYRLSERLIVFLRPRTLSQQWVVGEVFSCRPISTSSLFSSSPFSFLKVVFSKTLTLMISLHRATDHFGNKVKQKSSHCNAYTQRYHNLFKVELHFGHDIKREHHVVTSTSTEKRFWNYSAWLKEPRRLLLVMKWTLLYLFLTAHVCTWK